MEKNISRMIQGMEQVTELGLKVTFFEKDRSQNAAGAASRMIRAASLLGEKAFIGWQLETDAIDSMRMYAFAGGGAGVSGADLEWVFDKCVKEKDVTGREMTDLFDDGRQVFVLAERKNGTEEYQEEGVEDQLFWELLTALCDQHAVIRFLAGGGQGQILISLPEAMTMRLRTILSMLMPEYECREAENTECSGAGVSPKTLQAVMVGMLNAGMSVRWPHLVVSEKADSAQEAAEEAPESEPVPDPEPEAETEEQVDEEIDLDLDVEIAEDLDLDLTGLSDEDWEKEKEEEKRMLHADDSIDALDLTVRAWNFLQRNRISTVGELVRAAAENYSNCPRLGEKVRKELTEKLASVKVEAVEKVDYKALLDGLTGLENVKEQMRKIAAFARMKKDMAEKGKSTEPIVLNMEFTGNPGTAKTTVARIAAGILYEIGLLNSWVPLEVGRANLVGKYVGHTADQVREIFSRARGRLLFIDEAYSLADGGEHDFGDEALSTMVQEMENHREETVVVFAGYPGKMEELFERNPGLRSRVPFTLHFADYSTEEMLSITEKEAEKRGFALAPEAVEKASALCAAAVERGGAGNGRFCRNLVERAILEYASRVYGEKEDTADYILRAEDFSDPGTGEAAAPKRQIGFGA